MFAKGCCADLRADKHFDRKKCAGREMSKQNEGFDYHRYRNLLAGAVDEPKRLAFIDLLIEETQAALGQLGVHGAEAARTLAIRHPGALHF